MTNGHHAASAAAGLRASIVAQIAEQSGDAALAEEVAGALPLRALDHVEGPEAERLSAALEEYAQRLAVHRYQRRRAREDPARLALLVARPGHDVDLDLLATALDALPVGERMALELVHVDDYDGAEAAEFLGLDERAAARLVARARRRLRRAYRRLGGGSAVGAVVAVVVDGLRRRSAAFGRLTADSVESVAHWATLNPAPALAATTAAGLSLAVAVAVVTPDEAQPGTTPARPRAVAVADASLQAARDSGGDTPSTDVPPPHPTAREERGPVVVEHAVRPQPAGGSQAWYAQEAAPPLTPPQPGPPRDRDDDELWHVAFYDCPPPGDREPLEDVACPVLAP